MDNIVNKFTQKIYEVVNDEKNKKIIQKLSDDVKKYSKQIQKTVQVSNTNQSKEEFNNLNINLI
jgi:Na+/phosphate symporter